MFFAECIVQTLFIYFFILFINFLLLFIYLFIWLNIPLVAQGVVIVEALQSLRHTIPHRASLDW